jgi:hypothetical protein
VPQYYVTHIWSSVLFSEYIYAKLLRNKSATQYEYLFRSEKQERWYSNPSLYILPETSKRNVEVRSSHSQVYRTLYPRNHIL